MKKAKYEDVPEKDKKKSLEKRTEFDDWVDKIEETFEEVLDSETKK